MKKSRVSSAASAAWRLRSAGEPAAVLLLTAVLAGCGLGPAGPLDTRLVPAPAGCALPQPGPAHVIALAKDIGDPGKRPTPRDAAALFRHPIAIPLPGESAQIDFQSLDTAGNRLFIADVSGGSIALFDLADLTVTGTTGPIGAARGMTYVAGTNRVFVADPADRSVVVLDPASRHVVTRIPLGGAAASTVYDAASGCVLVSVPDRNALIAIDPGTATVSGAFVLADGDRPAALALDAADRLLFIANSGRATMTVVSLRSMEVVDVAPTGTPARDMAFDATWHRLYVITDNGRLSGYDLRRSRLFLTGVLDDIVASGIAVDPRSHTVYLATNSAERHPSLHIFEGVAPKAPRCVFHHATTGSPCFARYAPTR